MAHITSKVYFRTLNILYYALLMGQIILVIILFAARQVNLEGPDYTYLHSDLLYLVPIIVFASFIASVGIYRIYVKKISQKADLVEKMTAFRSAMIIRLAILEIPTFIAAVAYYMTKDLIFLGIAGLVILILLLLRPDKYQIAKSLALNSTEIARLEDPNELIAESSNQG